MKEITKLDRQKNNPDGLPVGAYTGRCRNCHSNDLWDDATVYGCNYCGAMFSNEAVRRVPNARPEKY